MHLRRLIAASVSTAFVAGSIALGITSASATVPLTSTAQISAPRAVRTLTPFAVHGTVTNGSGRRASWQHRTSSGWVTDVTVPVPVTGELSHWYVGFRLAGAYGFRLLVTSAGSPSAAASATASVALLPWTRTSMINVRPVLANGHLAPGYTVVATHTHAGCGPPAHNIGNVAYRCGYGQNIIEPCWKLVDPRNPHTPMAVCARAGQTAVVRLILDEWPARDGKPELRDLGSPWGFQLESGEICAKYAGTHGELNGRWMEYDCTGPEGFSVGALDGLHRRLQLWSADVAVFTKGGAVTQKTEHIIRAWYALPNPS